MKFFKLLSTLIWGIFCSTLSLDALTTEDSGTLYGLVHWDGMQTTNKGVAVLPTTAEEWTGRLNYVWTTRTYPYNYGGVHFEDKYFCDFLRIMDGYILEQKAYILDEKTGEEIDVIQLPTAFDLYDGYYYEPEEIIYAFVRDMSTNYYGWARVNPRTAKMEMVKRYPSITLYGVVVTDEGQAYGISGEGEVYSIDRLTGDAVLLFKHEDLEIKTVPKAHTGAAWDDENKRIVYAVCNLDKDGGSRLFSVDPSKQAVDLMYKLDGYGTQLAGLYFEQAINPLAPASPSDLSVSFPASSLSGTLQFTVPEKYYNGEKLEGEVEYVVKIDGLKVAEGKSNPGTVVNENVTVEEAGWHTFYVRCGNENGNSRSAKLETFVGYEAPLPPSNISARHYGGKMHITWTPSPAIGAKGGPVDVDNIEYVINTSQGETFITDPGVAMFEYSLPVPESFIPWRCTISARNEEGTSSAASGNNVPLGVIKGDYYEDFTKESSKYSFTTLDSNNDGITWQWNEEGLMAIRYNDTLPMDDYLTLPPMNMDYGDFYVLEFDAGVYNFEEEIEVKLSEDYNQAGMDNGVTVYGPVVLPVVNFREESWHHQNVVIQAPDDSKFFISIHGVSPADRNVILVDNVYVRKLASGSVPGAVTDLVATPDSKGGRSVIIKGNLPTKDVSGNSVSSVDYIKIYRNGEFVVTLQTNGESSFTWTDDRAAIGENLYVVTLGNASGDGLNERCTAFVGFVTPKSPEECEIKYLDDNYKSIEFSWTPVTEDLNGKDVTDVVTYDVIRSLDGDLSYAAKGLKKENYTERFSSLKAPVYVQYGTYACVDGVDGDMIASPQVPVGPSYSLPLVEGFNSVIKMAYGLDLDLKNDDSGLFTTNDTEQYQSPDGDGGYGVFIGVSAGESATVYTAWISIPEDAVEPVATIQYFGEGDAIANMIYIGVSTALYENFKLEESIETGGMGWQKAEVDLGAYRGKDVRLALKFETRRNTYLRFDDFRVYDKGESGVEEVLNNGSYMILAGSGFLSVRNTNEASVRIHTLEGKKIHQGEGDITLNVKPGVYVVTVDSESIKVLVK